MSFNLINILPGAQLLIKCLRFALTIVALLLLVCSVGQYLNCPVTWIRIISIACMILNILYIILMFILTSRKYYSMELRDYNILYCILLLSSVAAIIMFLCGGDYSLYEILGEYILFESEKVILPIATVIFVSITYWLPINSIRNIYSKYNHFNRIKENIEYGK